MRHKLSFTVLAVFSLLFIPLKIVSENEKAYVFIPDMLNHLHVTQGQAHQIIRNGVVTIITESGSYHVLENIDSQIIVDASDVFIELNGFTITGLIPAEGADPAVVLIGAEQKNVLVQNGTIMGVDQVNDGVKLEAGASAVVLKELHISNCNNGIDFEGTEDLPIGCCQVLNCFITGCVKGAELTYMMMSVFENTETCCCSLASFDLINCKYNKFKKCKAVRTGSNQADQSAVGYSAVGGLDNLFYECMAEGIYKDGEGSGWCTKSMGFFFGFDADNAPEMESKIVNCLVDSVKSVGKAVSYGIRLDTILYDDEPIRKDHGDIATTSFLHTEIDWSPNCDLIAFAEYEDVQEEGTANYKLVRFNGTDITEYINSISFPIGDFIPSSIQFSYDGQFLSVTDIGGNDLKIYDVATGRLLDTINTDIAPTYARWFNCGHKIVLSGSPNDPNSSFRIYTFDGSKLHEINVPVTNVQTDDNYSVFMGISPDDKILAVNSAQDDVLRFVDLDSFTVLGGDAIGVISLFNPIACCGQYYLAALDSTSTLRVIGYVPGDSTILTTLSSVGLDEIADFKWHSSGKYIAVARSIGIVDIYEFDPTASEESVLTLKLSYPTLVGPGNITIDFSPCGGFLAILGSKDDVTLTDFEIIEVGDSVKKCLVDSNKVANGAGGLCSIGIFGCGCCNGIMRNVAYENCINFGQAVYDVWCNGAVGIDQLHANVSIPPY